MKKLFLAALTLLCASAIVVQAQDAGSKDATGSKPAAKQHKLTAEQQAVMKDMLAKYDTNKDGKLDKTERAAMTQEDKDKMAKAGLSKAKKPAAEAPAADAPAAPSGK
jgi:ABC-type transporter MlaC component